jgi:hypothetical protein
MVRFREPSAALGMTNLTFPDVEVQLRNIFTGAFWSVFQADKSVYFSVILGGIPSPTPLESRAGRGFCKNGLQNLERLGFSSQNLERQGVSSRVAGFPSTASAFAMMRFLKTRSKGRCHKLPLWIFSQMGRCENS